LYKSFRFLFLKEGPEAFFILYRWNIWYESFILRLRLVTWTR